MSPLPKLTDKLRDLLRRAAGEYLRRGVMGNHWYLYKGLLSLLDSEGKLRAEVRDLKARLKAARVESNREWKAARMGGQAAARIDRATDLRNTSWRKARGEGR